MAADLVWLGGEVAERAGAGADAVVEDWSLDINARPRIGEVGRDCEGDVEDAAVEVGGALTEERQTPGEGVLAVRE